MKQVFIQKIKGNQKLLLFFSGWASDEQLVNDIKITKDYDILLCYDYRDLNFDSSLLGGYVSIRLMAWSMGVWAANQILNAQHLPYDLKIAINGTRTPIHDSEGIPVEIFHGTIAHLSTSSLRKFYRRMCGSSEQFKIFSTHLPHRSIEELKEELIQIEKIAHQETTGLLKWDKVIIGLNDLIFPVSNQRNSWKDTSNIEELPISHYNHQLFSDCLSGKEEIWTKS